MLQEQEVDFAADVPSLADTMVDVTGSFEVPGLLHIIHNAGRSLEDTFMLFSGAVQRLTKVAAMLSKRKSKDRLFETCFAHSPLGRTFWQHGLFKFDCNTDSISFLYN